MKCTSNRGESSTAEFSETQSEGESDRELSEHCSQEDLSFASIDR